MDPNNPPEPIFLGRFGLVRDQAAAPADAPVTFEFCGETFTVAPYLSVAPFMAFSAAITKADSLSDLRFLAAMDALVREVLGADPDDESTHSEYLRFMATAAKHKADSMAVLTVCRTVYEFYTLRPTTRPTGSSAGPRTTSTSSSGPSSRAAKAIEPSAQPRTRVAKRAPKARGTGGSRRASPA